MLWIKKKTSKNNSRH